MLTKIAVISDIHGNKEALLKVLENIKQKNIKRIICLGDIISKGTHPNECIDLVKENCFVVLKGNSDRFHTSEKEYIKQSDEDKKFIREERGRITDENLHYLRNLDYSYEFYMSGSLIRLFHASPESDQKVVLNIDTIERKKSMFLPSDKTLTNKNADIVLYGHTHEQYLDKLFNKTLVNVGSVGMPFNLIRDEKFDSDIKEITNAHYVIIEGKLNSKTYTEISFNFVRVPYNINKTLKSLKKDKTKKLSHHFIKTGMFEDMSEVEHGFDKRKEYF